MNTDEPKPKLDDSSRQGTVEDVRVQAMERMAKGEKIGHDLLPPRARRRPVVNAAIDLKVKRHM